MNNKYSNVVTPQGEKRLAKKFEKLLFDHEYKVSDQNYFKKWINAWLFLPIEVRPTFNQLLYNMVEKVNRKRPSKALRYCYFSEKTKTIIINKRFEFWANYVRKEIVKLYNR